MSPEEPILAVDVLRDMIGFLVLPLPGVLMMAPMLGFWLSVVMAAMLIAVVTLEISDSPPPPRRSARPRARSRGRKNLKG